MTDSVTMLDTIHDTVAGIPVNAAKVAGYVTGPPDICWDHDNWARFPRAGKVRVDQAAGLGVPDASDVADMEPGAKTIDAVIAWIRARHSRGWWSWPYVGIAGQLEPLRAAVRTAGLAHVQYWLCDEQLDQAEAEDKLDEGDGAIVAVQWASPSSNPHTIVPGTTATTLQTANVDLSVTIPGWFREPARGAF